MLYVAVSLLLTANIVNVGADLGAMAATGQLLIHLSFLAWLAVIVGISLALEVFVSYPAYARFLKYACLTLWPMSQRHSSSTIRGGQPSQ